MIIYKKTNLINNKIYIGQTTVSLNERLYAYNSEIKKADSNSRPIIKALIKYGKENFKIEIIDTARSLEELNEKEKYWIKELNTLVPLGYNLDSGGKNKIVHESTRKKLSKKSKLQPKGKLSPNYGKKQNQETINKRIKKLIGRLVSLETKEKIRQSNLGHSVSAETRSKISNTLKSKGFRPSDEHLKKLAERSKNQPKGKLSPNYGKKHSEESKLKISFKNRGENRPNSKFKEEDIINIRSSRLSVTELAKLYQVSYHTIHGIVTGKSWKHVGLDT